MIRLFYESGLAGLKYNGPGLISHGDVFPVRLVAEPDNRHDRNAIRVEPLELPPGRTKLGHVRADGAAWIKDGLWGCPYFAWLQADDDPLHGKDPKLKIIFIDADRRKLEHTGGIKARVGRLEKSTYARIVSPNLKWGEIQKPTDLGLATLKVRGKRQPLLLFQADQTGVDGFAISQVDLDLIDERAAAVPGSQPGIPAYLTRGRLLKRLAQRD